MDKPPFYLTSDKTSFAYISAKDRWPIIVTSAIDDMHRATSATPDHDRQAEGKRIVAELATLKHEMQHDRLLTPIPDDGVSDIAIYNNKLTELGTPTWFNLPWLYAECYLYRRINSIFTLSQHWKNYDVFAAQKISSFRSSRPAVLELAARYNELISQTKPDAKANSELKNDGVLEAEMLLFKEVCEICLWGNATDLSLLTSLTYDDIQTLQGSAARKKSEKNILVDELPAAYQVLKEAQRNAGNKDRRVDIILDNAGFELFVDLVMAGYLLSANLATTVVLHPKSIPWFVSDVVPADFATLLGTLADPQSFYQASTDNVASPSDSKSRQLSDEEVENLGFVLQHWSSLQQDGKLIIRPNRFWTLFHGYDQLPAVDHRLFEDLKQCELVIFKGDLNYRKLTDDRVWDPTTPFSQAIGSLGVGSGVRTLALRTCKADVVVGLLPGDDERLKTTENGVGPEGERKWAWTGRWAVVQLCDGRAEADVMS